MSYKIYLETKDQTTEFAKEELMVYLKKMLKDVADVCEVASEAAADLVLQVDESLDASIVTPAVDDCVAIVLTEGKGMVQGNNSRSLLLAVYKLLDALGCRFLRPGKAHEVIPQVSVADLTVTCVEKASYRHRGVCIEGADSLEVIKDFIDWLPKVGYNSFFIQFENPYSFLKRWYEHEFNPYLEKEAFSNQLAQKMSDEIDQEMAKRQLIHHRVGHGWTGEVLGFSSKFGWESGVELPAEKLEYAAMLKGKRDLFQTAPILTSLCFSNQTVVAKMTDTIVAYARSHQEVDYLHVWLSDAHNNICECEACQKENPADQYVQILNQLDEKLTQEGLATKICFLLYHELLFAPQREALKNPSRYVMMFAPISRTFEKSYGAVDYDNEIPEAKAYQRNQIVLPNSLEENISYLFDWQKVYQGDSFVYDYPLGRAHYGDLGYVKISQTIYQDIKYLAKLNLNGYISCQELRAGLPNNFPNYVMGKALWNSDVVYDELVTEYFSAAYGEQGMAVYNYLEQLSTFSSCDYFNAIGPRLDPVMGARYEVIAAVTADFLPVIKANMIEQQGLQQEFWTILSYHRQYAQLIAAGLQQLCLGKAGAAQANWEEFLHYIRKNERRMEGHLDVYRVIEVAKNYAGFHLTV